MAKANMKAISIRYSMTMSASHSIQGIWSSIDVRVTERGANDILEAYLVMDVQGISHSAVQLLVVHNLPS